MAVQGEVREEFGEVGFSCTAGGHFFSLAIEEYSDLLMQYWHGETRL